jgi:predicted aldo/keto reductase-like oxidoreductase
MTTLSLPQIPFGKRSGFQIPRVNIGAMRLPADEDAAVELIRFAIDNGMRYIDTSRGYGDSEIKLGKALKNGYREKVILSTKWAPWITKIEPEDDASKDTVIKRIEESMKRLDVDYLDFYQVWNIQDRSNYEQARRKGGFVDGIRAAKSRGLVGHLGITSHAPVDDLLQFIDEMDWCEIILLTYNMLNKTYGPVLTKAKEKGIGTIVMNPVGGGKLTEESAVFEPFVKASGSRDLAELAIRYVLSNPSVDTIISGISKISDVSHICETAQSRPLSAEIIAAIDATVTRLSPVNSHFCTSCGYCMPCPSNVNIPKVMEAIYNKRFLGLSKEAAQIYASIGTYSWVPGSRANACTSCNACVAKCTQKLDIPAEMAYAKEQFAL